MGVRFQPKIFFLFLYFVFRLHLVLILRYLERGKGVRSNAKLYLCRKVWPRGESVCPMLYFPIYIKGVIPPDATKKNKSIVM